MVARTNPRFYFSQWLLNGSWLQSEDRRAIRQFQQQCWHFMTSDWFKRWAERVTFWGLAALGIVMLYTYSSFECWMGRECWWANASWANWLWENIFSRPWWPK
jgi:hypothetical protein